MRIFKIFICFATIVMTPIGYAFFFDRSVMTKSLVLPRLATSRVSGSSTSRMAQVSQEEARKGIDKVVAVLKRDASAKTELGQLDQVTAVLGYGSPMPGTLAVRFNAGGQQYLYRLGWVNQRNRKDEDRWLVKLRRPWI